MKVTKHAKTRIKERCGVGKKSSDRVAKLALEKGIPHSRTKGQLNRWISKLFFNNTKANNIIIYGDKAYIFVGSTLITVLQIPPNLTKNLSKMIIEEKDGEKNG